MCNLSLCWLALLALVLSVPLRAETEREQAVAEALDGFHTAAAEADFQRYSASMTEDVVFLGTDGSERWQGEDFRKFARPYFDSGRGWTYHVLGRQVTLLPGHPVAWFDEALAHDTLGRCRGSGVMVRQEGRWRVAQYNLSLPIPNAMIEGVAATITAAEAAGSGVDADPGDVRDKSASDCRRKRFKTNRKAGC